MKTLPIRLFPLFLFVLTHLLYSCNKLSDNELQVLWFGYTQMKSANANFEGYNEKILRKIEKEFNDNGNKPADAIIKEKAEAIHEKTIEIVESLQKIQAEFDQRSDTVFLKETMRKEQQLDSSILRKINGYTENLERLKKLGLNAQKTKHTAVIPAKPAIISGIKGIFLVLELENMKMEAYKLERKLLDDCYGAMEIFELNPSKVTYFLTANQKYLTRGDTLKVKINALKIIQLKNLKMMINNENIEVDSKGVGQSNLKAFAKSFNSNGIGVQTISGKVIFKIRGKDTSFSSISTFYVKKRN